MNILQLAFEENQEPDSNTISADTIKLEGPLANAYTEALNTALSKEEPITVTDVVSQESFSAQQAQISTVATMVKDEEDTKITNPSTVVVYALNNAVATHSDVKNISTMLANGEDKPEQEVVIITDTSLPDVKAGVLGAGSTNVLIPAIESLIEAYGAKRFNSLPSFINSIKKR